MGVIRHLKNQIKKKQELVYSIRNFKNLVYLRIYHLKRKQIIGRNYGRLLGHYRRLKKILWNLTYKKQNILRFIPTVCLWSRPLTVGLKNGLKMITSESKIQTYLGLPIRQSKTLKSQLNLSTSVVIKQSQMMTKDGSNGIVITKQTDSQKQVLKDAMNDIRNRIYTDYARGFPNTIYELFTADDMINQLLENECCEVSWDSLNVEMVEFYYIVCYCIAVKFIDDVIYGNIFSGENGYSRYIKSEKYKSSKVFKECEIIVLKLIDYRIPRYDYLNIENFVL